MKFSIPVFCAFFCLTMISSCEKSEKNLEKEEIHSVPLNYEPTELSEKGDFVYDLGENIEVHLDNGEKIKVGNNSFEFRLLHFLDNPNEEIFNHSTLGWMTLDQIGFYENQVQLNESAVGQLKRLAKILKNYPEFQIKMGAFTSDEDFDQDQLAAILKQFTAILTQKGISAARIQTQVFGNVQQVCPSNDTPACQAQNRRFDVKVWKVN